MNRARATLSVLVLTLLTPIAGSAPAATSAVQQSNQWPQWQGPNRDGVSTETGLLQSWPEGGPELLWTATGLGEGFGGVSIQNGRVYTMGSRDGKETVIGTRSQQ